MVATLLGGALAVLAVMRFAEADEPTGVDPNGRHPGDPCYQLTDEQCHARIANMWAEFERRYAKAVRELNEDQPDLHTLPRVESLADYGPPEPSLNAAVDAADLIMVVESQQVRFHPEISLGSTVTVAIERTLKGNAAEGPISIEQGGHPEFPPDWDSPKIADTPAEPLLLPGDRAVVFLDRHLETGHFEIQPWSGYYAIDSSGRIHAVDLNPFRSQVEGLTLDEFMSLVENVLAD